MRAPRDYQGNRKNPGLTGVIQRSGNSVYRAISQNDNHSRQLASAPGRIGAADLSAEDRRRGAALPACRRGWRERVWGDLENGSAGFGTFKTPDMAPWGTKAVGTKAFGTKALGTRASANTSGPDFMEGFGPDEIADQRSAPNEENQFLLPDRFSKEQAPRKYDPAV
jgi:hypothetical protein